MMMPMMPPGMMGQFPGQPVMMAQYPGGPQFVAAAGGPAFMVGPAGMQVGEASELHVGTISCFMSVF
jgi:hypothetical protein